MDQAFFIRLMQRKKFKRSGVKGDQKLKERVIANRQNR